MNEVQKNQFTNMFKNIDKTPRLITSRGIYHEQKK